MNNIFVLLVCYIAHLGAQNYTLTAPKTFTPGSSYTFTLTLYGKRNVEYLLHAKIESPSSRKIVAQDGFDINQSSPSHEFKLIIPSDIPDERSYNFVVRARGDINFRGSRQVLANKKTHSLFIQTDKYHYKPGQKILFRVLGIDSELKPYTGSISINIYDKSDNCIYKQENQKNISGVINGHLQLSDITPLGRWKIVANSETLKKEVYFEVAEYVLPKFEVEVLLPNYFIINKNNPSAQKALLVTTVATYTFGKPVKGFAVISISLKYPWRSYSTNTNSAPYIRKNVILSNGKADVSVTLDELNQLSSGGLQANYYSLFVQSNVTEEVTGIILQGNNTVPLVSNKYKLKFLTISADNFKPGFNYKAYVRLSQADDSEPLPVDLRHPNGSFKSLVVEVTSSKSRRYNSFWWSEPFTQTDQRLFYVPILDSGYIFFEIATENDWTRMDIKVSYLDTECLTNLTSFKSLDRLKVRDQNYIQLSLPQNDRSIKPKSDLKLNVQTSELISGFNYQILGKGRLLLSNSYYSSKRTNNIDFTIDVSESLALNLAPVATIVVSCVTSAGELVADSLTLSVSDYFANKVSISFDPESTSPGKEVLLRVNATENSFVSLLAVDQSVLLLGAGNDITKDMIEKDIYSYTGTGNFENNVVNFGGFRCPIWRGGQDTYRIFDNAGLFVLSDYHIYNNDRPIFRDYAMTGPRFHVSIAGAVYTSSKYTFEKFAPQALSSPSPNIPSPSPDIPSSSIETNSPRKTFPESWVWSDVIMGSNGVLNLKYKVPDTMTSWIATAFATNTKFGLGIANHSAKITVIKPFFINLNLPPSIIRGEQFALQVTVFNYYGRDLTVDVTLSNSNYFQTVKCVNDIEILVNEDVTKSVLVPNNDMVTVYIWISATSLGQIPIKVKAVAGVAADSVIINLLVKPEGQPQEHSSSLLFRIPQEQPRIKMFNLTLPPENILVPGSVTIEATVIGDILGVTVNNLDNLLKMPHGCGEQNMVNLAPDVYIVKYLTAVNKLSDETKKKALEFINKGYQQQLTYQRKDGSFSAFGDRDSAGSIWLSSYVAKVFRQSSEYILLSDSKLAQCLNWILEHQDSNGIFREPPGGRVLATSMQGGASSGISLTAYVAISLLLNMKTAGVNNIHNRIQLTISYLEAQYNSFSNDSYVLSIIGYAFYLSGSSKLIHVLQLLDTLAINKDGFKCWRKADQLQSQPGTWRSPYEEAYSQDIEMTSYVLLIHASRDNFGNSLPIAKWLISKRNPEGGFVSTQDTVLGLEALAEFGKLIQSESNSDGLTVKVSQDATSEVYTFATIDYYSALLLQSHQLPSNAKRAIFSASGKGFALIQINVRYYVNATKENPLIKQKLTVNSNDEKLDLNVCVSWSGIEVTGMVLTEVNLLTGFTLSSDYENVLANEIGSAFKRQELGNNRLSIYLDGLMEKDLCFIVKMEKTFYVKLVKPALVKTYRYYSPNQLASGYYSKTSSLESWNACDPLFI